MLTQHCCKHNPYQVPISYPGHSADGFIQSDLQCIFYLILLLLNEGEGATCPTIPTGRLWVVGLGVKHHKL